jgi:tRNA(Ile2) C34 agmatinyltransferase TiaS
MSALRAFRKPEVSVFRQDLLDLQNSSTVSSVHEAGTGSTFTVVKLHNTDEREPLPLALHHTPLSITYGVLGVKQHLMAGAKQQVPHHQLAPLLSLTL